jgi:uncharacterized protein (TIGR02453 family)
MDNTSTLKPALIFLNGLGQNNFKAWFEQHRPDYLAARAVFEQFTNEIIDEFRAPDHLEGLAARDCIPRIYRDIRFSKDKTPYKTNLAALIGPGGWKGASSLGYYISIEPHDQSLAAGGLHAPMPEELNRFRQAINRDAAAFKKVIGNREFTKVFGAVEGERLKTAPKGYDKTHPEIALLQLKQVTVFHHFTDEEVLRGDFKDQVISICRAMRSFLNILGRMVE